MNTESFLRGRIGQTILEGDVLPFDLTLSILPNNDNQFITISPDTENEEIFYYSTVNGTPGEAGTVTVTGRGYNSYDDIQDVENYNNHSINNIFKGALNHIIIGSKADVDGDNTFTGNQTVDGDLEVNGDTTINGDLTSTGKFKVPVFADEAERDTIIDIPEDGTICYLNDVEDYYAYQNGIWVKGLGGASGGAVTWYQDSTDDGTLSGTIDGVNTTYVLSNQPAQPQAIILTYNGQILEYGASDDYVITGQTITMNFAPVSGKLMAIYPDTPIGTNVAETRVTSNTDANNGELYRSTNDNSSLYYKDNNGDVIKLMDSTTKLIPGGIIDYTGVVLNEGNIANAKATDTEVLEGIEDTKFVTSKGIKDKINNIGENQESKGFNTNYEALTSGLVQSYVDVVQSPSTGENTRLVGYTDSNTTPTTVVMTSGRLSEDGGSSITFFVKAGDYYRVDKDTSDAVYTGGITFISLI